MSTREPELPRFGKSTLIPKPIKAKINRAYETIHNLGAEIGPFFKAHRYRVIVDSDTEAPEPSYRIGEPDIDPAPDLHRFSVLAGEVLYHLRSSLDLLVWQLILRNGRDPASLHTLPEFPIYRDRQKYKSEGVRKIHGVSPFAKAVIDEAQPYAGSGRGYSDEALWNVHQLNIQDKHRLLNTVVGFATVRFKFDGTTFQILYGPMKGRAVRFSGPPGSELEMDMEPDQIFHVALGEAGILETESIIDTLQFFSDCIWTLICKFEREFV